MKDLCNSLNQYFPSYQHMTLQNHAQIKDPFKGQNAPTNFNETRNKNFTHMTSESTLQLTFKKPPFWFQCSSKSSEKAIQIFLPLQLQICIPDFLHVPQPKQHITTDGMYSSDQTLSCLEPDIKRDLQKYKVIRVGATYGQGPKRCKPLGIK